MQSGNSWPPGYKQAGLRSGYNVRCPGCNRSRGYLSAETAVSRYSSMGM